MDKQQKENLKKQRLLQYKAQIFNRQMDMAAFEAVGESENAEACKKDIERLQKALKAVEVI